MNGLKNSILSLLTSIVFCIALHGQQLLYINEVMSTNGTVIADEDGDFEDWIELYNASSVTIPLQGFYLSDDTNNPFKWQINAPVSIEGGAFLLFWASGKNRITSNGYHTNFRLSSSGEPVILSAPNGVQIDAIPPRAIPGDWSYGRYQDGSDSLILFQQPTPGRANNDAASQNYRDAILSSHLSGFYNEPFHLTLQTTDSSATILYSLDGSTPSLKYEKDLFLDFNARVDTGIHLISTVINNFRTANNPIPTVHTIRAVPVKDGKAIGPELFQTFWVRANLPDSLHLPQVSLITHPDNLFDDEKGIMVAGADDFLNFNGTGIEWERVAHFQYFERNKNLVVQQDIGIRGHGGGTRRSHQKSLRLYARNAYGKNTIDYPFFVQKPELTSFRRLLLGTTHGDWTHTLFKDELTVDFVKNMSVDYQAFQPIEVYVNGQYWGVYFLRERIDRFFLEANRGVDPDNLDLIATDREIAEGDAVALDRFLAQLATADYESPEYFNLIAENVDINRWLDYVISRIFLADGDWKHNYRRWRYREDSAKWNFIYFDCDGCMIWHTRDMITPLVKGEMEKLPHEGEFYTEITGHMMRVPEIQELFYNRFLNLLANDFGTHRLLQKLDSMVAVFNPVVAEHLNRWPIPDNTYEWRQNVKELEKFILQRPAVVLAQLKAMRESPFELSPIPATNRLQIRDNHREHRNVNAIRLFDIYGRSFPLEDRILQGYPDLDIDVVDLLPGVYIIEIQMGVMVFRHKFVKQ